MKKTILALMLIVIFLAGCQFENSLSKIESQETEDNFAAFLKDNDIKKSGDEYLFEGDIFLSEEEVQELYINQKTNSKGNICLWDDGTRRVWSHADKMNLTYSFDTNMATDSLTDAQVKAAFRSAIQLWMNACEIRLTEVSANNGRIHVITGHFDDNFYGAANRPYHSKQRVMVHLDYVDDVYDTQAKMVGLFTHEMGHTLGLYHEHDYGKVMEPYGQKDPDSVMDYANRPYTNGPSLGDIAVTQHLYGPFSDRGIVTSVFGYDTGWRVDKHPRLTADINGDGKDDIIAFGNNGVYVALGNASGGFAYRGNALPNLFCYDNGWRIDRHPRFMGDVNGDGRDDIIGIANNGIYVALGTTAGGFIYKGNVKPDIFTYNAGWRVDTHPRMTGDFNGDGKCDIIGFGEAGVYLALGTSDGGFFYKGNVLAGNFSWNSGWKEELHPRRTADVNGDGKDDIIGFGEYGVSVALGTTSGGFTYLGNVLSGRFGWGDGWRVEKHLRELGDVNGDGKDDIVGFGTSGVYVALGTSSGSFNYIGQKLNGSFSYNYGWRVDQHPRILKDVNGDGRVDIVAFGSPRVQVGKGTSSGGFSFEINALSNIFTANTGIQMDKHPRLVADITGDGKGDLICFTSAGVQTAVSYY